VHALTVLDDHSRFALAGHLDHAPSTEAAITVFEAAALRWGLADRFQYDKGSAFESIAFRQGIAQLGVHRNAVKARTPEWQGKVEAYHRSLTRWFVLELRAERVVDLGHLQQLFEAMLALLYNRHHHRELATSPEKRLAGRVSERRVSRAVLHRAFFLPTTARVHPKTGEVRLPNGRFRLPSPYAGTGHRFAYHPVHAQAVLLTPQGHELALSPFIVQPLAAVKPQSPQRGSGQLQKLLDRFAGRPLAEPGFGLPELFAELAKRLGRTVPQSEREALALAAFYRRHGPLGRDDFTAACARTEAALGKGRPLSAFLEHLTRQIHAEAHRDADDDNPHSPPPLRRTDR